MFGFLIGALSLYGLIKVLRWGRGGACGGGWRGRRGWHGGHGWNGGHGWRHEHGGFAGEHDRGFRDGGGPGFWLRGLFRRLDTTPGQEKVLRQAAQDVMNAVGPLKGEMQDSRRDIAQALRSGTVDEVAMGELFARHDEKLREARKAFIGALASVSEALDEDQRKRLADFIDRNGGWSGFGGPYRSY